MRADALGLWWRDEPIVKKTKEVIKCVPPDPVWLKDDYLPDLQEALDFKIPIMTDVELIEAFQEGHKLIFDVESYWNYFCVSFMSYTTGKIVYFETTDCFNEDECCKLIWILTNFCIVSFNGIKYDIPILSLAVTGEETSVMKEATNKIIAEDIRAKEVLKMYGVNLLIGLNHIDLIEVAPLRASLKRYGGRLHAPRMQDLPFHHEAKLNEKQRSIVLWYNVNDLLNTAYLLQALEEQIELREQLSKENSTDLRSKSDAQIAESVISRQLRRMGVRPTRPEIEVGTKYRYRVPSFLKFESPLMQWAVQVIANSQFPVAFHGSIDMPKEISRLHLKIGDNVYKMGIGGLHSSEQKVAYKANKDYFIEDRDVTSYYPAIILNQALFPQHLGEPFLKVYGGIAARRVEAKKAGQKVIADSLKITVNGTFGKLGSKYSIFYSPDLLIQVTLTGQLSLLMLIERLEMAGIQAISANTDGVVIYCPVMLRDRMHEIVKQWEIDTGFDTEDTHYSAYYARDVNNYIAVKLPDKNGNITVKSKGAYNNPWNHMEEGQGVFRLHKNPVTTVCLDAVEALLTRNIPITHTIRQCKDICKFVTVRKVKGGAVKDGQFLGQDIRWYYTINEGVIVYASSGKKVPKSDGAKPLMKLPEEFPDDVNFEWYEKEAEKTLREIAYIID